MIEKIAVMLINILLEDGRIEEKDKEIYVYSMQVLVEKVISVIAIFIFAFIWNVVLETVLFLVSFSMVRKHAGGYHAKSFRGCLIGSLGIYAIYTKYVYFFVEKYIYMNFILLVLMVVVLLIIGGVNHPNMDWSEEEYRENKKITRIVAITEMVCISVLFYFGMGKSYILYMSFGIMLSAVLLALGKIIKQEVSEDEEGKQKNDALYSGENG